MLIRYWSCLGNFVLVNTSEGINTKFIESYSFVYIFKSCFNNFSLKTRICWLQISGFPNILTSFPKEWNTKLQLPTKICSRIMSLLKNGYYFYTYQIFFSRKSSKNKNTRLKMIHRRVNHLNSLSRRWLWIDLIQTCFKCRYFTCFFLWKKELEKWKTNVCFFNLFISKIAFFANY